jgi:hypothetical protein
MLEDGLMELASELMCDDGAERGVKLVGVGGRAERSKAPMGDGCRRGGAGKAVEVSILAACEEGMGGSISIS